MNRRTLILSEYGVYLPESASILEFMYLSEKAAAEKEKRQKAAKNGQNYVK